MQIFSNISRTVIIIAAGIFIALRLLGDAIFFSIGMEDNSTMSFWRIISSVIIIASVVLYFFSASNESTIKDNESLSEKFISEYFRHLILLFGLSMLMIFTPKSFDDSIISWGFVLFIFNEITLIAALVISAFTLWFLFKWLGFRRHKKTNLYMKIIGIGLTYLFFIEIVSKISTFFGSFAEINNWFLLVLSILVFAVSRKNTWIASLPRSRKNRIFWLSLFVMVISISIAGSVLSNESKFGEMVSFNLPGAYYLFTSSMLFMFFYSIRIFFAVVASYPTSNIVEKKTSEVSTLTYLNRFIIDSTHKDINYLLETVSQLALHVSGGGSVWTEVYKSDGSIIIGSSINVNGQHIDQMINNTRITDIFKKVNTPLLIESVPETPEFAPLLKYLPNSKTLIAIPLFQNTTRFGTLILTDSEEYGFEYDDIKILAAFGDNVNLALENARLLKDSIEKERALSELMIAKRIQKELLPDKLPTLKCFDIAAMTSPAEEVGGDYYDVAHFSDGKPCLLIGDVSGKGMSAAFYMAQLKGVVQSLAEQSNSPAELLRKINRILFGLMDKQSYVTMLCLKIDDCNGLISFARAGHPPLLAKLGTKLAQFTPKGLGIGLAADSLFAGAIEEQTINMDSGDCCLLITDGISELRDDNGKELGYEPLFDALRNDVFSATDIIDNVKSIADQYLNGKNAHDDITLMAVFYNKNLD